MKLTIYFTIALVVHLGIVACSKRLVLHSEQDIATQLVSMETRFSQLETKLTQENQQLEARLAHLERDNQQLRTNRGGSVYVRWGRTVCPGNGSTPVYKGYMGGSKYDQGGGTNSLCLPDDPTWGFHEDGVQIIRGSVYGTEIDVDTGFTLPIFGYEYSQHDPSCVLCSVQRPQVLMIPGRTNCYPGWTEEYTGYILSGMPGHTGGTDYACLDSKAESVPHGEHNDDQRTMYFTEAHCGSLPCPPYHDGWEIACVVCSK